MPGTDQVLPHCLLTQTQPSSDISDPFQTNTQGSTFALLICKIFESFHLHIFYVCGFGRLAHTYNAIGPSN